MKVIRPIRAADLPALLDLAMAANGDRPLQPSAAALLGEKIAQSEASFAADVDAPGAQRYLFVMAETGTGAIEAACAIDAACGLDEPYWSYRVGTAIHASRELGVGHPLPTLYRCSDLSGCSLLGSLHRKPGLRGDGVDKLLSKCRFLFMANFPERFAAKVIAELHGVADDQGRSPFWEGLGRHFFSADHTEIERLAGGGSKASIAELMPAHPIYANLLSPAAQAAIGQVHPDTEPVLQLLEQEGFRYQGYIDILDGGPSVEAPLEEIRSIRRSQVVNVFIGKPLPGSPCLIANTQLDNFRCVHAEVGIKNGHITLSPELAKVLDVDSGDELRFSALA